MAVNLNNRSGNNATKSSLLKVILLGDGGVGKSCLMNRFVNGQFDANACHTIGVEFLNKDIVVKGERYTLQIWDTAGQERFRSLRTPFYRGSDICMLTYGVDDRKSFQNLNMWKKEFLQYADIRDYENFPFIIIGNKVDMETKEVSTDEVKQWCQQNKNCPYVETSAKDATNVEQAFHMAVENWLQMEQRMEELYMDETVDLSKHSQKRACCSLL
ncbi:ras-related protein Rab-9B-like [Centruroides sculpturatus]|uniref:ras-related protein Rab-9B-like n=1 Tax=Centruroides sculpturatus TaxID=218467 RepID=UPI000C6D3D50|nr:ras-related protein Rab-9B-like [Centruroides sculpturatus]XP_023218761.1 ras-related protein Rab-9B-like [Centruroides sculpturatus]